MWRSAAKYGSILCGTGLAGFLGLKYRHQKHAIDKKCQYRMSNIPSREANIERLKKEKFDVLIIGGGSIGSGVALDAASRGLNCALIEGDDFASGTSSRSTKLIHGGVRYLEKAFLKLDYEQLKLVIEALEERSHMMQIAPHMTSPIPIITPIYNLFDTLYLYVGIKLYDLVAKLACAFDTRVPECYYMSRSNTIFNFPSIKDEGLKGSIVYYDGQHNDARMNLMLSLSSTISDWVPNMCPAAAANHLKVEKLLFDEEGKVNGVLAHDHCSDETFEIRASQVVNCTGPFADHIRKMDDPQCPKLVIPSAGVHLVLPAHYAPKSFGLLNPKTTDDRVLFLLPWHNNVLAGTTDGGGEVSSLPKASTEDVQFIVNELAHMTKIPAEQIQSDVLATWSGIRPLIRNPRQHLEANAETNELSRTHEIIVSPSTLISVMGGKWTTYRQIAQDATDEIVSQLLLKGAIKKSDVKKCRTRNMRVIGSYGDTNHHQHIAELHNHFSSHIDYSTAKYLYNNYGSQSWVLCHEGVRNNSLVPLIREVKKEKQGTSVDNEKVSSVEYPYVKAEVHYAIRHEMARTVADVLGRRLRLGFVDAGAALSIRDDVLCILTAELDWDKSREEKERKDATEYLNSLSPFM